MIRMLVAVNHCVVGTCCVGTATVRERERERETLPAGVHVQIKL